MTHDKISGQEHLSSNYEWIPCAQEGRGKVGHVNKVCVRFLKDPNRTSRDENCNAKDGKHTDGINNGYTEYQKKNKWTLRGSSSHNLK